MYTAVIIDDNKMTADALSNLEIWKSLGVLIVDVCYDSTSGLNAILEKSPDLIMTDIRMPGMNGLDVVEKIKQTLPEAKVIVISAYDDFSYAQRALRLGALDYLVKPFSQDALMESVRRALAATEGSKKVDKDTNQEPTLIAPIIQYMTERIDQHLTAEEVARVFYMSASRLDKLFRKYHGKGFREVRIELSMNKARNLLLDIRYSVEEIALKTGYKNYTSFYRAFTREFGSSPTEYRDQLTLSRKDMGDEE